MNVRTLGPNQTEVSVNSKGTVFFSYNTPVAACVPGLGYIKRNEFFSVTTSKHVNRWLPKEYKTIEPEEFLQLIAF